MVELVIDNKNGMMWDISAIAADIEWKTSRIGKPGSLSFTLIKGAIYQSVDFQYHNGDIVRFRFGDRDVFYGYIFSIDGGKDENVSIVAYDQIRYLLTTDTYVLKNVTASDVVRQIAADTELAVGRLDDTGYKIPTMIEDGRKLLDIICKALDLTLIHTGRNFFLYDDFGSLSVRNVEDLLLDFIVGDGSLMTDFSIKTSIDSDTYN
ncbi:MAG: hypothetical protein J7639_30805, partial [Paenibacillaceae bacterium]|nr:hypothetical protein [Paenibacillaceae bacterium]